MSKNSQPEWAKRLEDWGHEMEAKYGNHAKTSPEKVAEWKRENPGSTIISNIISYLLVTYVPPYFPGFFLTGFSAVRAVIVAVVLVNIAVSVVLLVIPLRPVYHLGHVIMELAAVVSMVTMVTIFPFNFPGTIGHIVQFGLWIAIVVVSIVAFFEFLKIFGDNRAE